MAMYAVGLGECQCKTEDIVRAQVDTAPATEECEPILFCGDLSEEQAERHICVCDQAADYTEAERAEEIWLISDGQCLGPGLVFGSDSMDAVSLLIVLLAVSTLCGYVGFGIGLTKENTHNSTRLFFAIEFLDAVMDVASYVSASNSGDLIFSNDNGSVSTALAVSVWASVIVHFFELCAFSQREALSVEFAELIPYLLCLHVITEDFFQSLVYIAVATSHLTVPIWFGMLQAVAFTCVKMYELIASDEVVKDDIDDDG